MKLLLTSAGLTNASLQKAFIENISKPVDQIKLYFITTASYPEEDKRNLESSFELYKKTGVKNIIRFDFANVNINVTLKEFGPADVISMEGGNTFYLLHQLRVTGLAEKLKSICENKLYVGVSAGSIVVTPNINIATAEPPDENIVGLTDLSGLNWVDFEISPHTPEQVTYKTFEEYSKTTKNKIIGIDDNSGILVIDDRKTMITEGQYREYN